MDIALEVIGWIGSILIVWSLVVARVIRFRWINLAGAVIATGYNAAIEVWPFVFMNLAIVVIDVYWLWRLYREAHSDAAYRVVAVPADDPFLEHFHAVHADDIARHQPSFAQALAHPEGLHTFLVARGDEPVGVVALRSESDGVGLVELDWVKERFRDLTPGEFVYRQSGALSEAGFTRLRVPTHEGLDRDYLRRMGFSAEGPHWVREVAA